MIRIALALWLFPAALALAAPLELTVADYQRAENALPFNTSQRVDRTSVNPNWLPGGKRFWYRVMTAEGAEFILVDAERKTRTPAFDHARLAQALSSALGKTYTAARLPFESIEFSADGGSLTFVAAKKNWTYTPVSGELTSAPVPAAFARAGARSPDGTREAFIRDHNLWIRNVVTREEKPLTTDGVEDYGYATDNAGWRHSNAAIVLWSPDSKKIATFRQDQRTVGEMYLVTTNVGKPKLQRWKYPLPGDKSIPMLERVIIEIDPVKVIELRIPPDPHRSTQCDDIVCAGVWSDVEWSPDSTQLAFVSSSRDHKQARFRIADAKTGAVREVFAETVATQFESGHDALNWRYLARTNEILWYSERDGWGHLYRYDARTGALKNRITKGEWTVTRVLKVDERAHLIYFLGGGREAGRNPYYAHLYKVDFDGRHLTLLTPEDAHHSIALSPDAPFFVDVWSRQDVPPTAVLRNFDGALMLPLEKADISRLTATGWKPPLPFSVKARDGKTDLYGVLWTPSNLDPAAKYPIVNRIYPGPQGGSVGNWGFAEASGDNQALAELGFVVVSIEGGCNPKRSKAFHDSCYGNMADNTLPDQIAGMKELAARFPYIDLERVGIWGHSGGGFATAAALFRYPDFFKVGVAESGNHDNRNYEDDWGERYIGLLTNDASGKSNYEDQANQKYAASLKGKLMIVHGMMDDNVPPYNTLLVVDALQKANKDFDLVIFPGARHSFGEYSNYMMRRRWDYFVTNLLGAQHPKEFKITVRRDPRNVVEE